MSLRRIVWLGVIVLLPALARGGDAPPLSLADLAAYQEALEKPAEGPAEAVTFRMLWDHPERFEGKRVQVEGQVVRRFRQGAVGAFPALVELWIVSPAGDPLCLAFAVPSGATRDADLASAAPGARVRFEGTFLRMIRYRGSDVDRLAPWIVGARPAVVVTPAARPSASTAAPASEQESDRLPWLVALGVASVVALTLARRHIQGSARPPRDDSREAPPEFLDGA